MSGCWICGSDDIAYTDPIGCEWCLEHYEEFYLDGPRRSGKDVPCTE